MSEKDQVAVVTGTASAKGIGAAIARRLAEEGVAVAAVDIRETDDSKALVAGIVGSGGRAIALQADVSNAESVASMMDAVIAKFGSITILVNNAGITQAKRMAEMSEAEWDRIMSVNLKSCFLCARSALPFMKASGRGAIVNISSMAGRDGGSGFGGVHYAASKAGMIGFTRGLAREVAADNIRVNAIAPGSIETDIMAGLTTRSGQNNDAYRQERIARTPLGRLGAPLEIADAAAYLALRANFVTGVVLDVNGGRFIG